MYQEKAGRIFNSAMTRRVIELQAKGYDFDFFVFGRQLICVQNNQIFPVESVSIQVIDLAYDRTSRSYKYIHTVDTVQGDRGLVVIEGILTN